MFSRKTLTCFNMHILKFCFPVNSNIASANYSFRQDGVLTTSGRATRKLQNDRVEVSVIASGYLRRQERREKNREEGRG